MDEIKIIEIKESIFFVAPFELFTELMIIFVLLAGIIWYIWDVRIFLIYFICVYMLVLFMIWVVSKVSNTA